MARAARSRRLIGHRGPRGRTLIERHRDLLDKAMRRYFRLKDEVEQWDGTTPELVGARHAVRAYATVVALNEGGYYPDMKTSVKRAESMSVARVTRDFTDYHDCGGYILVNGMCSRGHDPTRY
jgi:hypothetical protein